MKGNPTEPAAFLREHERRLAPLLVESRTAYWEATTTGSDAASRRYARAVAQIRRLHSDPVQAEALRRWLREDRPTDPIVQRQLTLLEHEFTANLLPSETIDDLTEREAHLERIFTTFRAELDGERLSDNALRDILKGETSQAARRAAWEASKRVGREAAEPLRELVRQRNAAARTLGFPDYYRMGLALQEQDEEELFTLLHGFEESTTGPFTELRSGLDEQLAARFGIDRADLRPWHWEDFFAQEPPALGEVDLDRYVRDLDLVHLARGFFSGIGLPVDDVLARSDLYEREGKSQHAFCIDLDRAGDVRILCNLRPTEHWMMVLLHELGHAVYDQAIDPRLPFVLRTPAHTFCTEAIAMYFGRLTRDPEWLREVAGAPLDGQEALDVREQLRARMLVSTRWMLVMVHFERLLYRDPDRPDLNSTWWDLVERFQLIRRPEGRDEPDWAAKIHLSNAPVYYHNYLLGELAASQLSAHIEGSVRMGADGSGRRDRRVGEHLETRVFRPGASLRWDELIASATGAPLDARYFVDDFVAPHPDSEAGD